MPVSVQSQSPSNLTWQTLYFFAVNVALSIEETYADLTPLRFKMQSRQHWQRLFCLVSHCVLIAPLLSQPS